MALAQCVSDVMLTYPLNRGHSKIKPVE